MMEEMKPKDNQGEERPSPEPLINITLWTSINPGLAQA